MRHNQWLTVNITHCYSGVHFKPHAVLPEQSNTQNINITLRSQLVLFLPFASSQALVIHLAPIVERNKKIKNSFLSYK